jgi:hypothetical protein
VTDLSPTAQAALDAAAADLNGDDAPTGPPCGRCGHPLPPLPEELQKVIDSGHSVALMHEPGTCPTDEPAKPAGKYYEVRVAVVRVDESDTDEVTELLSFVAGHRAANLGDAMRPLALALGEKWQKAEKNAGIAEAPDGD